MATNRLLSNGSLTAWELLQELMDIFLLLGLLDGHFCDVP
jgi:hypothetical protein